MATRRPARSRVLHERRGLPLPARHDGLAHLRRGATARRGARRHRHRRADCRRRARAYRVRRARFRARRPTPARVRRAAHRAGPRARGARATTIGAVEGVQGISWQELTIVGQSNHAGTTPMSMRHDAAYAAAEIVTYLRRLATEIGGHQVATVGRLDLHPDLVNVIARSSRAHGRPSQHRRRSARSGRRGARRVLRRPRTQ